MKYWTVAISFKSGDVLIKHISSANSCHAIYDVLADFSTFYKYNSQITSITIEQIPPEKYHELNR